MTLTIAILLMIKNFCMTYEKHSPEMCAQEMKTCMHNFRYMGTTLETIFKRCKDEYYD